MSHIQKRTLPSGKTSWQARVSTTQDGKRHQVARDFASKADALAWCRDRASLIERKRVKGSSASVAAYIERWLSFLEGRGRLEHKTMYSYRSRLRPLMEIIGAIRLDRLTPHDLDHAYSRLLQRGRTKGKDRGPGLSARTVHVTAMTLHAALERAVKWRLVPVNVAKEAEVPGPGRSPAVAPTADELHRYLQAAEGTPWRLFILTALATGLRRGELCALSWRNVDLDGKSLRVTQSMWDAGGQFGIKPRGKTAAAMRTLALPAFLADELRAHWARQAEERLMHGKYWRSDLNLVFCQLGGEPWGPSQVTRAVSAIARGAGLPRNCAPLHSLRHAHATAMLAEGIAAKVASSRLGHSSTRITLDLYSHSTAELDEAAAAAVERALLPLVKRPS